MTGPIPFVTTRWRCPSCPRTLSSRARMAEHIGRCWNNPAAHGCRTCEWFQHRVSEPSVGYFSTEACRKGVALPIDGRGNQTLAVHCDSWEEDEIKKL